VLHGLARSMTVNFPWASLLRGVLGHDDVVLAGMARLLAPGASASALVSVLPRDDAPEVPGAGALAAAYARVGLHLEAARPAAAAAVAASGSSWAKRLRAGRERPVTLLRFTRAAAGVGIMAADDICRRVQS
jgi:16S rRNA (adenine(1408)-N(1))-methyltransferase